MSGDCKPSRRRLFDWEIEDFEVVFGDRLQYSRVWVHECVKFPNRIDDIGRKLFRRPPRPTNQNNAITLGNRCMFPVLLPRDASPGSWSKSWLIHELTHVWQYQQMGASYLFKALRAQKSLGDEAYNIGNDDEIRRRRERGRKLSDLNLEQQGKLVQVYYERLRKGGNVSVLQPFIDDIRFG